MYYHVSNTESDVLRAYPRFPIHHSLSQNRKHITYLSFACKVRRDPIESNQPRKCDRGIGFYYFHITSHSRGYNYIHYPPHTESEHLFSAKSSTTDRETYISISNIRGGKVSAPTDGKYSQTERKACGGRGCHVSDRGVHTCPRVNTWKDNLDRVKHQPLINKIFKLKSLSLISPSTLSFSVPLSLSLSESWSASEAKA